ncbi:CHC2 zinc finger domain-containing protein [Neobacillus drentensis]|uniref:CHC2 zinc finger domain-containing protein n=1 Tax=Neobacillus drentensis TaxID=220684 RepID=UPI002FFFF2C7
MPNNNKYFRFLAEEVIKRQDIVEVAEKKGLRLRKKGRNYFALCPFHSERTASFSINQKKQIFKCSLCEGWQRNYFFCCLRWVNNGKIINQYAKVFGLVNNLKVSRKQQHEIKKLMIKYEFKNLNPLLHNSVVTFFSIVYCLGRMAFIFFDRCSFENISVIIKYLGQSKY